MTINEQKRLEELKLQGTMTRADVEDYMRLLELQKEDEKKVEEAHEVVPEAAPVEEEKPVMSSGSKKSKKVEEVPTEDEKVVEDPHKEGEFSE